MRAVQEGDRVQVHFVKRAQHGGVVSSRGGDPLEVTVGTAHRRLPGLGLALVGRSEGDKVRLLVPAAQAYGPSNPKRIRRLARSRFTEDEILLNGRWVHATDRKGRRRLVRIVEARDNLVVVDANHPWAGQTVALEVRIVSIITPAPGAPPLP